MDFRDDALNPDTAELLSAYIDDALSADERRDLEARLRAEPALQQELDTLRQTVALMRALPERKAPRDFTLTPEMVAQADAARTGASQAAPQIRPRIVPRIAPRRPIWQPLTAAAAAVLIVAAGLFVIFDQLPLTTQPGDQVQVAAVFTATADVSVGTGARSAQPEVLDVVPQAAPPETAVEEAAVEEAAEAEMADSVPPIAEEPAQAAPDLRQPTTPTVAPAPTQMPLPSPEIATMPEAASIPSGPRTAGAADDAAETDSAAESEGLSFESAEADPMLATPDPALFVDGLRLSVRAALAAIIEQAPAAAPLVRVLAALLTALGIPLP